MRHSMYLQSTPMRWNALVKQAFLRTESYYTLCESQTRVKREAWRDGADGCGQDITTPPIVQCEETNWVIEAGFVLFLRRSQLSKKLRQNAASTAIDSP